MERPDELTLRILARLADGATAAEAAVACNVSESTLNRRLLSLRRAWGLENNTQVLVRAVRVGLV
ncbi:helix-turn-helix domain-containing protein [Nocardioides dongkuii]|uniref:helix-turn-helix domain-containing protein n=1 Tax=Nocardioides dongkuii TaxID=2760089 RepID=UPI0015F8166B|nr:helix-turn-helix domain-containing protein [Nocardioides dongkuii]